MNKSLFLPSLLIASAALAPQLLSAQQCESKQPKYVFYFITDGTGINCITGTEMMNAELQGRWGRDTLLMSTFPVVSFATTYSFNSGITDSAASGTCLATGTKTFNGAIGVGPDTTNVYSVAYYAHQAGIPVGVASSVCINHATPSSFYAHNKNRSNYYDIALQAAASGYDFFGGPDFTLERPHRDDRDNVYAACQSAGYTMVRGYDEYVAKADQADKLILMQPLERTLRGQDNSLPYAIDAQPGEMSVYDVTKAEIDFLYKKSQKLGDVGFFLMNEIGGKVDYACHANDGATTFREVELVDSCLQLAYDFYLQHPDETLILLTSDHETGGVGLGTTHGGYVANLKIFANQHCSLDAITGHMKQLRAKTGNKVSWEQIKELLGQDLGFWQTVSIDEREEARLKDVFVRSFEGQMDNVENLYSANEPLAATAVRMLNDKAHLGWTSGAHTAAVVPVYAIGVGAYTFAKHNDNSVFAPALIKLAGYQK